MKIMRKTFTKMSNSFYHLGGKMYLLLVFILIGTAAEAQYCKATHYYGCTYNTTGLRYAAIEDVKFEDNAGNVLFSKVGDGCNDKTAAINTGHHNVIGTPNTFTMSYGSDVVLKVNGSNPGYAFYTTMNLGVWVDLNRDEDFGDAGEFMGSYTVATSNPPSGLTTIKFTLPCGASGSGTSRIRLRSMYQYRAPFQKNEHCKTNYLYIYGETEDYPVKLENPSTIKAGFFVSDTSFIGTPVLLTNANPKGYTGHQWDIGDDGTNEYVTTNAKHKFTTTGQKCVRLFSQNCLGRDSIVKCFQIVTPTAPPVADFVSSSNSVQLFTAFDITDLSTNGATYWDWKIFQPGDSLNTVIDGNTLPQLSGGDENFNKNPSIFTAKGIPGFPGVGKWSVCLTSSNSVGSSKEVCKSGYIEVEKGCEEIEMGPGTITNIPGNVIVCTAGSIVNKDDGLGNYSTPEAGLDALIAPCGASEVVLEFSQWEVKANVNLKIYDGQNSNGIPLHSANGFTSANAPSGKYTATSGAIYVLWNSTGTATDKGFKASWTSTVGTLTAPTAKFEIPDTIFNAVENTFVNTSLQAKGEVFYTWEVDNSVQATSKDFKTTFLSNAAYNVCLTVETCVSPMSKTCKTVHVIAPDRKADLDFTADNQRPKTGQTVTLQASSQVANTFKWTFFPSNSVSFVNGTNVNSVEPQVRFSAAGKYTVSLRGWNYVDSAKTVATLIKDQFIITIDYCNPLIGVTSSSDVAINDVILEDGAMNVLIANSTAQGDYNDYTTDFKPAVLTFGSENTITVKRNTTANPISRKVWIDYNIDGDFDDAGELVAMEMPAQTTSFSKTFTVPDLSSAFEGPTRMRIGVSYKNDPNEPCGASSGVKNANRIGEFEDYPIMLSNDNTTPILSLIGNDTVYVEQDGVYSDLGATAMDPTEGDITHRIGASSDVDTSASGIYFVTYTVNDASGNAADPITRVVYVVVDRTNPVITLNGLSTVFVDVVTGTYNEPGFTAKDNRDGDLTSAVLVNGSVNTFKIGTYVLDYSVQDAQRNSTLVKRTVIVQDTFAPILSNQEIKPENGRNVVQVQLQSVFVDRTEVSENYNNGIYADLYARTATPGTNGIADVDTRVKGTTVANYVATDETGNMSTLEIDYIVEDYIAPVINLNTLDTVYHPVFATYTAVEASVSDNLYDATQVSLTKTSNVDPFVLGRYFDTYTATDASGNISTKTRTVRVGDGSRPVISGINGPILKVGIASQLSVFDYIKATDNYDSPAILMGNMELMSTDLNTYAEGIYSAVFRTWDNSGNESAPFTLIIVVDYDYYVINGVEDVNGDDALKVYPNPSNGIFNVSIDLASNETIDVAIFDILGNKVADVINGELTNGVYPIDLTSKANGVYFVRMAVNDKVYNQRIILNK
jgi:hypothetical protein